MVYDPIPVEDGGFKKGSVMTKKQLKCMLQPEFRALAVGTILEDLHGRQFTIDQRPYGNGLTMEECDVPEG